MVLGRKKNQIEHLEQDSASEAPIETYSVVYKGGLSYIPKAKAGKIEMKIFADRIAFEPTIGSKAFWPELEIAYDAISNLEIAERKVSTFEGLAGGLNSRQLNQKNNIHISYVGAEGETLLRLEMLSGVTVMGQAKKCDELEDRLRTLRIRERFRPDIKDVTVTQGSLAEELEKLSTLRESGALTEEEFSLAKARLLGS